MIDMFAHFEGCAFVALLPPRGFVAFLPFTLGFPGFILAGRLAGSSTVPLKQSFQLGQFQFHSCQFCFQKVQLEFEDQALGTGFFHGPSTLPVFEIQVSLLSSYKKARLVQ